MSESVRLHAGPMAAPTLAELQVDPSLLNALPVDALVALGFEVRMLAAEIERSVTTRLLAGPGRDAYSGDVGVLTTGRLATLWGMKNAKIRELCRAGRIPARKLGTKEWVVPLEGLREWARQALVDGPGARHNADHVSPRSGAGRGRRHAVEVRRPRLASPEGA
jgi:hypothetical protein